ncbi:MAG TPA: TetR/AcrR family transcriptional regulator [Pseudonocardiaceae bacterium]|jgi:AcrR family transcriptional regulator|nr:TetR/AcrR family transcriptional regulator [Pseudonocardiaceae bacterium]
MTSSKPTTEPHTPARSPMRARFREQVREDVKAAALRQLAQGGAAAISVNAIAKQLGVSGPALYRYFANRDELLAELVIDAYHDLAAELATATDRELGLSPGERLRAFATAWRGFAQSEPHRYQLLFTPPLPGYDAHSEPLVTASQTVMTAALAVLEDERQILSAWTRLHGFVTLELGGNFASMGIDADVLFAGEVAAIVDAAPTSDQ